MRGGAENAAPPTTGAEGGDEHSGGRGAHVEDSTSAAVAALLELARVVTVRIRALAEHATEGDLERIARAYLDAGSTAGAELVRRSAGGDA